jgi:hypothetical protein
VENDDGIIKEINLKKDRYKYINELLDFTIIEILKEENINNYLEINNIKYNKNDQIFLFHYPKGEKLKYNIVYYFFNKKIIFFILLINGDGNWELGPIPNPQ